MAEFDGVIIGAGHNGLTLAAYLTRAGLRIAVLERNARIGGGSSTEERILPGYKLNLHANFYMGIGFCPLLRKTTGTPAEVEGTTVTVTGTDETGSSEMFELDPNTAAPWVVADVNGYQFGVKTKA